jgi:hypothetical protein
MSHRFALLIATFTLVMNAAAQSPDEQCTSALILGEASVSGGSILWKNRDTDHLSNKVVFVDETPHDYLCLANADSASGRSCWAGLNSAGFGIINTVAYNLPRKRDESRDLEGMIMADALRVCSSIDDFEAYLQANLGPELGSLANFGVMDSSGRALLFEVHNHGFTRQDPAGATGAFLVNTNFARSGADGEGAGYLRFERASQLFAELGGAPIDHQLILHRFSRDTGHVLIDQPTVFELSGRPANEALWISTRDTINKVSTSAAVVLVGRNPGREHSVATMWVIPGEPVTAVAIPLWVEAGGSPTALWQGEEAPLWRESSRLKRLVRPDSRGSKNNYLNLTVLANREGTGFLPGLLAAESEIMEMTREFLGRGHTAEEYAAHQEAMATRALAVMRAAARSESEAAGSTALRQDG